MSYTYQTVNQDGLVLEEWRRFLTEEEKEILTSELSDYEWHAVLKDNKVIAIFQIINVLNEYAKNLRIHFHPTFKQGESDIADIIIFIYQSMLEICDKKDIKKLKLYVDNSLMHAIFMIIATHQAESKDIIKVRNYSKWIEIQMK
jgi:molecular chaperone GrpE (heat shock protein)